MVVRRRAMHPGHPEMRRRGVQKPARHTRCMGTEDPSMVWNRSSRTLHRTAAAKAAPNAASPVSAQVT